MKEIDKIINNRRSVRKYDAEAEYDTNIVKECIRRATLAPNSSNMQLWEFYKVNNPKIKEKLAEYCMNQSAARTANELVVIVTRKDLWRKRAQFNLDEIKKQFTGKPTKQLKRATGYYSKMLPYLYFDIFGIIGRVKAIISYVWGFFRPIYREVKASDVRVVAHKSAALAAQTFMLSMSAEGYDTCPMEGFDSLKVRKELNLPCGAEINMIIACGKRAEDGIYTERIRVPFEEVYFEV